MSKLFCRYTRLGFLVSTASAILALSTLATAVPIADEMAARQRAAPVSTNQSRAVLVIHAVAGGWGDASTNDIETVLYSVAAVFLEHFPGRHLDPIVVSHSDTDPITLFERGPNNEYLVHLSVSGRYWAGYAYEFAHELSHILSNYEHRAYSSGTNQWFEESLCEVASLYALKELSVVWDLSPPYPGWAAYAPTFARYAQHHLNENHRRLPQGISLAAWFERNERDLAQTPYLRADNELVANALLPLFDENPRIWEAIGYLNLQVHGGNFRDYLQAWHASAPDEYKDTIRYIARLFGIDPSFQRSWANASSHQAAAAVDAAPLPKLSRPLPAQESAAVPFTLDTRPMVARGPKWANFERERASRDARYVASWVVDSGDSKSMPFAIVDKTDAKVFVFDADGHLRGATAALLGLAPGDGSVPGIGDRALSDIRPEERTTPAGRFVAELGRNLRRETTLWVNYDEGFALHALRTSNPKERRAQRLATSTPLDNRVSLGCIVVPVNFFENVVRPAFTGTKGIVYVLPETKLASKVFSSYDVDERAQRQSASRYLGARNQSQQ